MPSPFPGMDPYLEDPDIWSDFHSTFLPVLRTALLRKLPDGYVLRLDRYVWIDESEDAEVRRLGKPDILVLDSVEGREESSTAVGVLAAPFVVTLPVAEPKGKMYLKIIDRIHRRIVTVVELLSPANKARGKDRDAYVAKRQEYLTHETNLVELDLLRAGLRAPVVEPLPPADYYVLVSRAVDYPSAGVWPITVREALPTIRVPLLPEDKPIPLALQRCLTRAFDGAEYGNDIDYTVPPVPPLSEADAAWARGLHVEKRPRKTRKKK